LSCNDWKINNDDSDISLTDKTDRNIRIELMIF